MKPQPQAVSKPTPELINPRRDRFSPELIAIVLLLALGIFQAVWLFGHKLVPNSDFSAFVDTGHELLRFHLPSSYKRAPLTGILQAGLSFLMPGPHPDLSAGWLLNSILHPLNLVLLYLVGRRLVGSAAFYLALLASMNPPLIQMLQEPLAEMTFLFFTLLSFELLARRTPWVYLAAAAAATMTRFEGAALILAAFLWDIGDDRRGRQVLRALLRSAAATLPLALWLLGTFLNWQRESASHYLKVMHLNQKTGPALGAYLDMLWSYNLLPLISWAPKAPPPGFFVLKLLVLAAMIGSLIIALKRRERLVPMLLLFLLLYSAIHILMPDFMYPRFGMPVFWIILLLAVYSAGQLWAWFRQRTRIPDLVISLLQALLSVVLLAWLFNLIYAIQTAKKISPQALPLLWAALLFLAAGAIYQAIFNRASRSAGLRPIGSSVTNAVSNPKSKIQNPKFSPIIGLLLTAAFLITQQPLQASFVNDGKMDAEFRDLALWYREHTHPGEKLVLTLSNIAAIFAPARKPDLVHKSTLAAETPEAFLALCRKNGIRYLAWDSRLGLAAGDFYYRAWRMDNLLPLRQPRDNGPYHFVKAFPNSSTGRVIFLFRLDQN